ncbi:MAG: PASTA domain-containing protein [Bacteroidota bacterium]
MARSESTSTSMFMDRAFWIGLLGIAAGLVGFVLLLNFAIMPLWTRHDAAIAVPNVSGMSAVEAEATLERAGLNAAPDRMIYNANLEADVVLEQNPEAGTEVKPGRRIYFYVNESPKQLVLVPDVVSLSEGVARPRVTEAGLVVAGTEIDSMRTPYENTVTRQVPNAGSQVRQGTRMTLWLSPGVGTRQVRVPDVAGLSTDEARSRLRQVGLWVDSPRATNGEVLWQDPDRGETLKEGQEVRIYTTPRDGVSDDPEDSESDDG